MDFDVYLIFRLYVAAWFIYQGWWVSYIGFQKQILRQESCAKDLLRKRSREKQRMGERGM